MLKTYSGKLLTKLEVTNANLKSPSQRSLMRSVPNNKPQKKKAWLWVLWTWQAESFQKLIRSCPRRLSKTKTSFKKYSKNSFSLLFFKPTKLMSTISQATCLISSSKKGLERSSYPPLALVNKSISPVKLLTNYSTNSFANHQWSWPTSLETNWSHCLIW